MTIKKNDFIEIEFTGRTTDDNKIFDTNIEADAKSSDLNTKDIKPHTLSVGHKMLPEGFDKDLEGKEIQKSYTIELKPEDAFGKRNPQMIRMIPTKHFHEQKINPQRGMQLTLDGQLVKILSESGGRTLVDFNNPLAGKSVKYDYKILKEVTNQKEKIDALQDFLFRRKFEFEVKENTITFKVPKEFEPLINMISPKFEEILKMKIIAEPEPKPEPADKE